MSGYFEDLLERAKQATTDAERWAVIHDAWVLYYTHGAGEFDWDYDSRDVMDILDSPAGRL